MTTTDFMLDTRINVQTPEGIELTLNPAGLLPRCLARIADFVITLGIWLAFLLVVYFVLGELADTLVYLAAFFLKWFYDVLFETFNNGRTPGKAAMGIRVVHTDGSPITFKTAVLRNLIRVVDALPAMYLLGAVSTLFTRTFQRLGDIVAGTYVVYAEEENELIPDDHSTERPLSLSLKAADHQAIMLFDERQQNLSDERIDEIAGLLSGLISGSPKQIRNKLRSHARWLTGGGSV